MSGSRFLRSVSLLVLLVGGCVPDNPHDPVRCEENGECDVDQDGFEAVETGGDDCDDAWACRPDENTVDMACVEQAQATYPGAPELCDGVDNDCDEQIDESAEDCAE